jgi:hypothetical protein
MIFTIEWLSTSPADIPVGHDPESCHCFPIKSIKIKGGHLANQIKTHIYIFTFLSFALRV